VDATLQRATGVDDLRLECWAETPEEERIDLGTVESKDLFTGENARYAVEITPRHKVRHALYACLYDGPRRIGYRPEHTRVREAWLEIWSRARERKDTYMTQSLSQTSSRLDPQLESPAVQEPTRHENGRTSVRKRLLALVQDEYDYARPRRGQIFKGVILDIGENDMIVDIGAKRDGVVPRTDLELLENTYRESLQVGDRVPVTVLRTTGREGGLTVSINKGLQQRDWLRAQELIESEQIVEAQVVNVNRGGVLVQFGRLCGFVPNSHLTSIPRGLHGQRRQEAKSELLGQTLRLVVIEAKPRRQRLVLSESQAARQRQEQLLRELNEGDVRTGVVTSLVDFGAFVDLGGADGLIHVSELDWRHVRRPEQVLSVGDEVEVYVLSVDRKKARIGLSRKRLLPDPWFAVTEALQVGQDAEGTVTNVVDFGAFVDLGDGVEGLIHVSEMPRGDETRTDLAPGSRVTVRVLEIDQDRRRIRLSLRDDPSRAPFKQQ
jgi:small subunit ribosomal protein S1